MKYLISRKIRLRFSRLCDERRTHGIAHRGEPSLSRGQVFRWGVEIFKQQGLIHRSTRPWIGGSMARAAAGVEGCKAKQVWVGGAS